MTHLMGVRGTRILSGIFFTAVWMIVFVSGAVAEINLIENDRNGDGRADSWEYLKNGTRFRWEVDKNFDGTADGIIHFKDSFVTFSEIDRNFDGVLDDRFHFKEGVRTLNTYDSNFDGRTDRWEHFGNGGRLMETEIDLDFDGKADRIVRSESDLLFSFEEAALGGSENE